MACQEIIQELPQEALRFLRMPEGPGVVQRSLRVSPEHGEATDFRITPEEPRVAPEEPSRTP